MSEHIDPLTQILFEGAQKIGDALTSANTYAAVAGSVSNAFSGIAGVADVIRSFSSAITDFASSNPEQVTTMLAQNMEPTLQAASIDAPNMELGGLTGPATPNFVASISQSQGVNSLG